MKPIVVVLLLTLTNIALAKSQCIDWVNILPGLGNENEVAGLAMDDNKNLYINGKWNNSCNGCPSALPKGTFTFKYNNNGNTIWSDINNKRIWKHQSLSLNDSFYYVSGLYYIDKYDLNDNLIWHIDSTVFYDVLCEYKNNQLYFTGSHNNISPVGDYLGSLDSNGYQKWVKPINYRPKNMTVTTNFIYLLEDNLSGNAQRLFKNDTLGNLIWSRYGNMGYIWNMTIDAQDNCYLIAADKIKKIDANGNDVWTINRSNDSVSYYNGVVDNDTLYVCGLGEYFSNPNTGSAISKSSITVCSSISGQVFSYHLFDIIPNKFEQAEFIIKDKNDIYLAGIGGDYMSKLFLTKVSLNNNITTKVKEIKGNSNLRIFPNPTQGLFQIEYVSLKKGTLQIKITDVNGRIVYTEAATKFDDEFKKQIDLSKQARGVYFIEIIAEKTKEVKKIVLE